MLDTIVSYLSSNPAVTAIVLSGSKTGLVSDEYSDYDLYIYSDSTIELSFRQTLADLFAKKAEVGNSFFDDGDEMVLQDGTALDIMYRPLSWAKNEVQRVWINHQASVGYSTAFIHNITYSQILFDRNGEYAQIQKSVQSAYPPQLIKTIFAKNYPLLRSKLMASYYEQLEKAIVRADHISVVHRTAALLASYFDILFALNKQTHPGEKQLILWAQKTCTELPIDFEEDLNQVFTLIATPKLLDAITILLDHFDQLVTKHQLVL